MKNMIEITDLTKTYGKHRGVENVSFSVKKGEIFGFLGSNGAENPQPYAPCLG